MQMFHFLAFFFLKPMFLIHVYGHVYVTMEIFMLAVIKNWILLLTVPSSSLRRWLLLVMIKLFISWGILNARMLKVNERD